MATFAKFYLNGKESMAGYLPASRVGNIEIRDEKQSWKKHLLSWADT